jgi:hypothetical protein
MKTRHFLFLAIFIYLLGISTLAAQSNSSTLLRGTITNQKGNPVAFANVLLLNTELGAITNEEGFYEISNIPAGFYNVRASYVGYKSSTAFEVQVSLAKPILIMLAKNRA